MIEFLFIDLDDTILDFHRAERAAIAETFRSFGLEPTEQVLNLYHEINIRHWQMLERGELTREQVLVNRFGVLFETLGKTVDPEKCARTYEHNLSLNHFFLPGALEAVQSLAKKYRMFLASNGTAVVQHRRLTDSGLYPYFEQVFISQKLGCNKPSKAYFDACFAQIPDFDPARAIMVGDSLTSDILGGIQAGLPTVWVNPRKEKPGNIVPDYEIQHIGELEGLLDTLSFHRHSLADDHGAFGDGAVHGKHLDSGSSGLPQGLAEGGIGLIVGMEGPDRRHLDHKENVGPIALLHRLGQPPQVLGTPVGRRIGKGTDPILLQGHTLDLQKAGLSLLTEGKIEPGVPVYRFRTQVFQGP